MTALKILAAVALLLLLLGLTRLGVTVAFGEETRVTARVGVFRMTLYPRRAGKRKQQEQAAEKAEKTTKPSLGEARELLGTALRALRKAARRACRRVRIDPLELTAVFGGSDPADTAAAFGAANALMHTLMPRLEETFRIPNPSLHLRVDFDRERTEARGAVGASLRARDLIIIALTLAAPFLKWQRERKKKQKG